MKVFSLAPREDWILDRFVKEWNEDNFDIATTTPFDADVIWLFSDWVWKQVPPELLRTRKVLTTIHHIVPEKFGVAEHRDFYERDLITDAYHVPNEYTLDFIRPLTQRPIHVIPYWANQKIWAQTENRYVLRQKFDLPIHHYLVGSFQRDSEGHDLISPKLEKGPDLLADFLVKKNESFKTHNFAINGAHPQYTLHIVLAGWRRQYLMNRLDIAKISYSYFERPDQTIINGLYQTLNLYPVTARQEGGPQSLIECGLLNVPVVSRPVGIASAVLPASAIHDNVYLATPAVPNVEILKLPNGYAKYRELLESL